MAGSPHTGMSLIHSWAWQGSQALPQVDDGEVLGMARVMRAFVLFILHFCLTALACHDEEVGHRCSAPSLRIPISDIYTSSLSCRDD